MLQRHRTVTVHLSHAGTNAVVSVMSKEIFKLGVTVKIQNCAARNHFRIHRLDSESDCDCIFFTVPTTTTGVTKVKSMIPCKMSSILDMSVTVQL